MFLMFVDKFVNIASLKPWAKKQQQQQKNDLYQNFEASVFFK